MALCSSLLARGQDNRYGVAPWHADFPVVLDLPTPSPQQTYRSSRRQALEQVAANLQGNTRREVWLMATELWDRAPDDGVPVLIEAMDRLVGHQDLRDKLVNVVEAMARMGRPEFEAPLRRLLEHPDETVRQVAFHALSVVAGEAVLRDLLPLFQRSMNGRARAAWVQGVRLRGGAAGRQMLREMMVSSTPIGLRDLILKEALKMPPAEACEVVAGMWEDAAPEFKAMLAGVLHSAGKVNGTLWLHNALDDSDPRLRMLALQSLRGRELGALRDDVMRCSTDDRPEVRLELAKVLVGRPDPDIGRVFELLAGSVELVETKSLALRELVKRGLPDLVTVLLEETATATGSKLEMNLRLLAASGDPRIVPLLRDRFLRAPAEEGRSFLQALATSQAPGAAAALLELFLAPVREITQKDARGEQLTTVNYLPMMMLNVRGEEAVLVAAFAKVPATDPVRRSLLLNTLAGIASDRQDPALRASIHGLLRQVLFDPAELPQLRMQALNALARRAIDFDDVLRLRRHQDGAIAEEAAGMRAFFKDYLFEYF